MSKSRFSSIAVLITASFAAGCVNYASFQEADTMPKGHVKQGVGVTYTSYKVDLGEETDTINVPAVNAWYRRGILDKLEAHAQAWVPLGASAGLKYQLLGDRTRSGFALSAGLDFGVLQSSYKDKEDKTIENTVVDTYVPVYLGYRLSPALAAYASPKYVLRVQLSDAGSEINHLAGGTAGIVLGEHTSLLLEGTVMYDTQLGAPAFQGGVGVAF